MAYAEASLFVNNISTETNLGQHIDTRGTTIESEIMDLLYGKSDVSPLTFIGTSDDEADPFIEAKFANVERDSYVRPVQMLGVDLFQKGPGHPTLRDFRDAARDQHPIKLQFLEWIRHASKVVTSTGCLQQTGKYKTLNIGHFV